jgi:hypothetical protein
MSENKRYKLIACEIMFREISYCASKCKNIIDITFMPKGLHDIGEKRMSEKLQNEIDKVDTEKYESILLCYGLCNYGIRGLHSKLPMVLPKAHDCITLLLGSRNKYNTYFQDNPGTFFKSSGWIERDTNPNDNEQSVISQLGMNKTYQEYIEKYGEENAKYLMEMLGDWFKNYKKITFIDTKTGDSEFYKELTKKQANEYQWEYDVVEGDIGLIYNLLNGDWDEQNYLVVPPDNNIISTFDDGLISFKPIVDDNEQV